MHPDDPTPALGRRARLLRRLRTRHGLLASLTLLLVSAFAAAGTFAAWSVTDTNTSTFSTTNVLLIDNQGGQAGSANTTGTALFTVTGISPGSSSTTACIGVNLTASAPGLTLSAALSGTGAGTLDSQLTLSTATYNTSGTVSATAGSNTNSGSCTSYPGTGTNTTIGSQVGSVSAWASAGPYTIASPVTNTWYKFTISGLPGGASCATYCGKTLTLALTWTLTST